MIWGKRKNSIFQVNVEENLSVCTQNTLKRLIQLKISSNTSQTTLQNVFDIQKFLEQVS